MRNIIIFGSCGFIGTHFKHYLNSDSQVSVIEYDIQRNQHEDVRQKISIDGNFDEKDIIINLAAIHKTPGHPEIDYFETNIKGAENICEFAEAKGINNMIFTSSIAPYGAGEDCKYEDTLPIPNTPYGISKLVAEYIHKEWVSIKNKRKLLIIRPGVVFGEGENGNYTRLFRAIKSGTFFYPGRKDTIKACIYVKDLVQLCFQIFNSFKSGGRTYNFTYEPAPTIENIVDIISKITGKRSPKIIVNGNLLKYTATILSPLGFRNLGIHPDRIKKLMLSTNISGKKILESNYTFNYNLEGAIKDWYIDCAQKGLF